MRAIPRALAAREPAHGLRDHALVTAVVGRRLLRGPPEASTELLGRRKTRGGGAGGVLVADCLSLSAVLFERVCRSSAVAGNTAGSGGGQRGGGGTCPAGMTMRHWMSSMALPWSPRALPTQLCSSFTYSSVPSSYTFHSPSAIHQAPFAKRQAPSFCPHGSSESRETARGIECTKRRPYVCACARARKHVRALFGGLWGTVHTSV